MQTDLCGDVVLSLKHLSHPSHTFFLWIKSVWVFACVLAMSVFELEAWDICMLYIPRQLIWMAGEHPDGMQVCKSRGDVCSFSFFTVLSVPKMVLILFHWCCPSCGFLGVQKTVTINIMLTQSCIKGFTVWAAVKVFKLKADFTY